ncbi:MAG TPA: NAD-dependent epimerase/dehydratase family protein [Verrucomicrobia bacterium]|mgnify:CR=1 FL=1|nr:NAD-dependent epimerase/dehydratase family protein [Verrucomicrobiota bacterium]
MVGSWLIRDLLKAGATVIALARKQATPSDPALQNVTWVWCPIEDRAGVERAVREHRPDTVFHLAAQSLVGAARTDPWQTFETNIRGTYNLLEACRLNGGAVKRVVVASSDKAYGPRNEPPYTEDMPLQGRGPYEVSKSCADLVAQAYCQNHGVPVAILRCGNVFGGGDLNWSRIVPATIRCCFKGERPVIRSDGRSVRDYIYVRDATRAYLRLAELLSDPRLHGQAFNVSLERPITVLEVVNLIRELMGRRDLEPEIQNVAQGEMRAEFMSTKKAREILGWRPGFTLEEGLRETIAWYGEYLKGAGELR